MNVLHLSLKPPRPTVDGGCVAINSLSELLINNPDNKVKLLSVSTTKHPDLSHLLDDDYLNKTDFESVFIDTKVNVFSFIKSLFQKFPYNIYRFKDKKFKERLHLVLNESGFDIVIIESLFMTPYVECIRENSKAKIILRSHNYESELWSNRAVNSTLIKRMLFKMMLFKLHRIEKMIGSKVDSVLCISQREQAFYRKNTNKIPIYHFPIQLKNIKNHFNTPIKKIKLFHIGAMDWQPNVDGMDWFFKNIWPKIDHLFEFHIAGKGLDEKKYVEFNNVYNHGFVQSSEDFIKNHDLMVVPLFSGSGIRIKILESMALGKPVVTTSKGIKGIPAKSGENVIISDTPNEMINIFHKIAHKKINLMELSKNTIEFVHERYGYNSIYFTLNEITKSLLK